MARSLGVILALLVLSSPALAQDKKRVAVLDFDYGTVRTVVQAYFGADQDVGKGISILLEQKLVEDGNYRVIDRNALEKILREQNFSNSDRADASTAAKIGRVLGVNALIVGSITEFGAENKNVGVSGGGFGLGRFGLGGVSSKSSKATVKVTAKLVDANTAEILAVVTGTGESKRSGFSIGGGGGGYGGGGGGAFSMGSSDFQNSILGEAVMAAVADMGQQLDGKAALLPTEKIQVSGLVADVSGTTLVLTVGSKSGVKVGDQLSISRKVREVKDPSTGAVIKTITEDLGTATVTQVDENSATATFNGPGTPKVGDIVKSQ
jgi:curli biogenesis system outer membrane secretion channel CsgG